LLGGDITVQSVWKQGTTMTVELPDLPASPQAALESTPDSGGVDDPT
jgi:hypothetical protein